MSDAIQVNGSTLRLVRGDITDLEIESFVYYAQHDLVLGSGFGNSISVRGGPSVQEELKQHGTLEMTEAVITSSGEMKSQYIVHAVGPRFQEADLENKLQKTILNSLQRAEEKGIKEIAFPPMGTGFYGIPLETSAKITVSTIMEYLSGGTSIENVVICLMDNREYKPFEAQIKQLAKK